jgi:hypothetical protein
MSGLPDALYDTPEVAWKWLVENCPGLFDGIDLKNEPYAHYLNGKSSSIIIDTSDLLQVARYFLKDLKLADISEALTGKREYGGAIYTRVKAISQLLNNTTTADEDARTFIVDDIAA